MIRLLIAMPILVVTLAVTGCSSTDKVQVSRSEVASYLDRYPGLLALPVRPPAGYHVRGVSYFPVKEGLYERCLDFTRWVDEPVGGRVCSRNQGQPRSSWRSTRQIVERRLGALHIDILFFQHNDKADTEWEDVMFTTELDRVSWFGQGMASA